MQLNWPHLTAKTNFVKYLMIAVKESGKFMYQLWGACYLTQIHHLVFTYFSSSHDLLIQSESRKCPVECRVMLLERLNERGKGRWGDIKRKSESEREREEKRNRMRWKEGLINYLKPTGRLSSSFPSNLPPSFNNSTSISIVPLEGIACDSWNF